MYIINQIKYTLIFLLISLLALNGCQTEQYNEFDRVGEIIELEDGKLLVPITLELPVYSVIESKATTNETIVKNIRVLVYDSEGKVIQSVEGKIGSTNNKMEAILQRYNNPCSIQVFANIPDRLLTMFQLGSTYSDINELLLNTSDLAGASTEGIPVLSQATSFKVLDPVNINGYTASLKYACARIDITCNTPGLTLAEVTLINAAKQSELGENINSLDLGGEEQRSTLSVSNNNIQKIYLFENSEVKAGTTDKNTTDLIVKINDGFYKICINYKNTDQTNNYSINRGYKYNVTINSVKGPGYKTFQEAKANKPVNIDYNITIDDGRSKDIVTSNGSYYLGVTNSEFYLFADEAKGVTVTHLSHNAPATVTNATLSVSGTGITLRASEGYTVTTSTTATLNLKNGAVQNLPVKLDLTSASTGGILTIRIGDLVKEIKIVQKANSPDVSGTYTIGYTEYDGYYFKTFTSLSDRLKISSKNLIMDNRPIYPDRNRVFAYATAFADETRKNVLIAVKRPAQEVIYYEKYQDNTYGFSYQDGSCSSLDMNNEKDIIETGYGVVNISPLNNSSIKIGNSTFTCPQVISSSIWEDYATGSFYPINQNELIKKETGNYYAVSVSINTKATSQYVFPHFAKGVYQTSTVYNTESKGSFNIRTPLHFRSINNVFNPLSNYYLQDHNIDFSKTSIGGFKDNITSPLIIGLFEGVYDGNNNHIKNMTFYNPSSPYLSLFEQNAGLLKNLHLYNISNVSAGSTGCLTGINQGTIEKVLIEDCILYSYGAYLGFLAGHNYVNGNINHCMVIADSRRYKAVYNYHQYTGAIVGCNHQSSRGITNICVIDINPNAQTDSVPIVHSNLADNFMGGIVGQNNALLSNVLFIGKIPNGTNKYPISGVNNTYGTIDQCYFLDVPLIITPGSNQPTLTGGGTGFRTKEAASLNLNPAYWIIDNKEGYPYPRLKDFPIPSDWPIY